MEVENKDVAHGRLDISGSGRDAFNILSTSVERERERARGSSQPPQTSVCETDRVSLPTKNHTNQ